MATKFERARDDFKKWNSRGANFNWLVEKEGPYFVLSIGALIAAGTYFAAFPTEWGVLALGAAPLTVVTLSWLAMRYSSHKQCEAEDRMRATPEGADLPLFL